MAPAIAGVAMGGGGVQNLALTRLLMPDELRKVQQNARTIRSSYKAPGK
jgi:hypothetical protein